MHSSSKKATEHDQLRGCRLFFVLCQQRSVCLFIIECVQATEGTPAALEQFVFLFSGVEQSAGFHRYNSVARLGSAAAPIERRTRSHSDTDLWFYLGN